jgi:crossover junction endodeoxyribonuclease RuvC
MGSKEKIILGIDPGTVILGYGLLEVKDKELSLLSLGVLHLNQYEDHALRLGKIFERITEIIDGFHPDELAIEAPFYGKNVQSMLKLGRAQGVAIAAALSRKLPVTEYAPRKVKQSITGNGNASKEQVSAMLIRLLNMQSTEMPKEFDATDALAIAVCHHFQSTSVVPTGGADSWKAFISKNPGRIK